MFQYDQLILDTIERQLDEETFKSYSTDWKAIDNGFHNSTWLYVESIESKVKWILDKTK